MDGNIAMRSMGWTDPSTANHWAANPMNPWDVNYDGDPDGWYGRTAFDIPAVQGALGARVHFTPSSQVIQPGIGSLPFTNWMEWDNETRPDLNDSVTKIQKLCDDYEQWSSH